MGDWGTTRLIQIGAVVLFVLFAGFGGWGMFAQISGAVIVPAYVDAGKDRHSLQHARGGRVVAVLAQNGDAIAAGDPLIQLDAGRLHTELSILQSQQDALQARGTRLRAIQAGTELVFPGTLNQRAKDNSDLARILQNERNVFIADNALFQQVIHQLEQQRSQLNIQRDGILAERRAAQNRFELVAATLNDQETLLLKGLVAAERVSNLAQQSAALEGDLARLETAYADSGARDAQVAMEMVRMKSDRHQKVVAELADIDIRLVGLEEQLHRLTTDIEDQTIVAPIDGVVHAMAFSVPGAVMRPGEAILDILPVGGQTRAIANLPPAHIDQVHLGQAVTLRLPDFGSRSAPELQGHITHISADAFVDQKHGQRFYRVEVDIPKGVLSELNDNQTLLPGMSVEAFIHTGAQRPLAYLTDPFLDYFRRAFRER